MHEKYDKLLKYLKVYEVPEGLKGRILMRVVEEREKVAKKAQTVKTFVFGSTSVLSLSFSAWAFSYLTSNLNESGFWNYLSLLFSENSIVLAYWKEFSFTLLESLPILGLIAFLGGVGVLVWSSVNIFRSAEQIGIRKMSIIN